MLDRLLFLSRVMAVTCPVSEVAAQFHPYLYLSSKDWTTRVIRDDLVATLGEEAIAYSTVTEYGDDAPIRPGDPTAVFDATSLHIDESGEAILMAIDELPFSSVPQLAHATHLRMITVYRRLSEKLGFPRRHFRSVQHVLSDDQKIKQLQW
jgi:hypothetical protein